MKYGLLYFKETANLGDDIQTYAGKQFLPNIDYLVEREELNCFMPDKTELVSVIMNAWYMHNKSAWPPSPYINPLLISMHFVNDEKGDTGEKYITGLGGEYLNKYSPVGARDISTMELLRKNNINTYFSGCMTLTLQKFENVTKGDYICVADTDEKVLQKIKENTDKEVKITTHNRNPEIMKNKTIDERMKEVEKQLKLYQGAALIITERLHVALPALALETPVILIRNNNTDPTEVNRFISLGELTNNCNLDEFLSKDVRSFLAKKHENPKDYIEIRKNLIKKCKEFIKYSKELEIIKELPDINEFGKYVKNIKWQNELYLQLKNKLKATIINNKSRKKIT